MSHAPAPSAKKKGVHGGALVLRNLFFLAALIVVIAWWKYSPRNENKGYTVVEEAASNSRPTPPPAQEYWSQMTPVTLRNVEGWANVEPDAPILVYYYRETDPVKIMPGGGCQVLRAPKYDGPKRFVSAADPNGHVTFRIYKMKGPC